MWLKSMPTQKEQRFYDTIYRVLQVVVRIVEDNQLLLTNNDPKQTKWQEMNSLMHRWTHDHHYDPMKILHRYGIFVEDDIYARYFEIISSSKRSQQRINKSEDLFDVDNHWDDWHLRRNKIERTERERDTFNNLPMLIIIIGRIKIRPREIVAASEERKILRWRNSNVGRCTGFHENKNGFFREFKKRFTIGIFFN